MARKPASQTPVRSGLSTASMTTAPAVPATTVSSGTPVPLDVPTTSAKAPARARPVSSSSREYAVCDLCGGQLGRNAGHFHMVSPLTARHVSVCRTCRRAALSEGYRPRA
jgi:hypothetical protein